MVGSYSVLLKRVSLNFFLCMGNGGWAVFVFFLVNFQFIFLGFFVLFWEL